MPQYKYCKCYRILHKLKGGKKILSICDFKYILSLKALLYMVNRILVQPLAALIVKYGPHRPSNSIHIIFKLSSHRIQFKKHVKDGVDNTNWKNNIVKGGYPECREYQGRNCKRQASWSSTHNMLLYGTNYLKVNKIRNT